MRVGYANQYQKPCIILHNRTEVMEDVIELAELEDAIFWDGPDEDVCYVVQFPGRPMELYTKNALIGSLPSMESKKAEEEQK